MIIYDYDITNATANLLPPNHRKPKILAYLSVVVWYLQKIHTRIFYRYADGDSSPDWSSGGTYAYESTVNYAHAIYECINPAGITGITIDPKKDTANWILVQDNFIGARERVKYTSSKISIEYALNRYFKVQSPVVPFQGASHTNQIYIANCTPPFHSFWLSNGGLGARTSYMAKNSHYQLNYLGNSYTYIPYNFIIYVPDAVWYTLGGSDEIREGVIRAIADKQVQCGKIYQVQHYT